MTIYFDKNLNAYNTKPTPCVGETEDYKWTFYSQLPKNIAWTVRDYQLVDLRDTEEYKEYQKQERIAEFNKEFFNTSLGYIRRSVNMKDGSHKDFLSDLLPTITMAVNMGQEVKVIAYNQPDFSHEVIDWTEYQHNETVTAQFIQECLLQQSADFGVVNESVEENNEQM